MKNNPMPLVTAKEHILNQVKRLAQNRWIRYSVQAIIIIWWLYFLYSTFSGATESLKNLRLDVSALSLALLLSIMSTLLGAPFWWLILLGLGHSSKLSVSGRIHLISGLTKYLPGFGWDYLSKAYLSKEIGIPNKTIGLGLLIELFQLVSMGCMISVLLFPLGLAEQIRGIAISTIAFKLTKSILLLPIAIVTIGYPFIIQKLYNQEKVVGKFFLFWILSLVAITGWILRGIALWCVGYSFTPLHISTLPLFIFTTAISMIIGLAMIFAPQGIGVREAVMVLVLTPLVDKPIALIIAVVSRIVMVIGDFSGTLFFLIAIRIRQRK